MNTVEIKAEIKTLGPAIRTMKAWFKDAQRKGDWDWQVGLRSECREKSRRCRHLLIAYGLLRGRPYECIEHPRQGNEPDWDLVREIQNARAA